MADIQKLFEVKVSEYWQTHYVFDTPSVSIAKTLGKDTVLLMIINVVIPFLFYYGTYRKEDKYIQRAFDFLRKVQPEKNSITEGWQKLGIPLESAHRTQALIHLKTEYCNKKRCLDCAIGNSVLNIK